MSRLESSVEDLDDDGDGPGVFSVSPRDELSKARDMLEDAVDEIYNDEFYEN